MIKENDKTCAVIGSGVSGIAAAIRMRNKGYRVVVFEANSFLGGKLSSETNKGYRFDMGPSVFTFPEYVDELFILSGKNPRDYFNYDRLDPVFRYFFEDGTSLESFDGKEKYASELAPKTKDTKEAILNYLDKTEKMYDLTAEVFLHNSLHKFKNYFTKAVAKGLLNFGKIGAFDTMNGANEKAFKDKRLVQIFNRYSTYNGSSPYLAPATLNVIPHVEIVKGAYYPHGGMHSITKSLVQLAKEIGVVFKFNSPVREIVVENNLTKGIKTDNGFEGFDVVISNMDVYNTYHKLLPSCKKPEKLLNQPKSSSGIIFYWGIKRRFDELSLHNILFSENYREEFETIFTKNSIYKDPSIYINITSKHSPGDAPEGCENWFTFINVTNNQGQDWDKFVNESREHVINKINRILKTDIRKLIECEMVFDPRVIESRTSSAFGAIYGNSSNNKFSAFLRHPNFSKKIKNLYFCGGSVHPGPSIPLCLLSAKITTSLIK
ncbi:1-hydroxycarotenoid 3,4-desaturase CrtD [Aurantibacillus circumpalustris]|uniref:1-hydroxycarotenoid 3,4-desaturase CrtD n=1 Tax=Aurantibacillus circumpalustris TaxID=3036359 RepID=UPI00295AAD93|nr:1-hydroxycarotenoid 3,4-desaturase CrtD [Aurantibacillus circumpalustris]